LSLLANESIGLVDRAPNSTASQAAFAYEALPYRVVFGEGTLARVADEADRLGIKRALVLTTPQQRGDGSKLGSILGHRLAAEFPEAVMHTPVAVTERALSVIEASDIDGLIALGGGSAIGLAKALSLRSGLPQLVLPTTYAGSEMTPILGETRDGIKTTQRSRDILPDTVIYDVDLTMSLPAAISATSGLNAMAHAVEALHSAGRCPASSRRRQIAMRGVMRCSAPGYAERASVQSACPCITSSATCLVARSICHMQRPMRSSCRTSSPTMRRPRRRPCAG
jgi:maleylacetate reductase